MKKLALGLAAMVAVVAGVAAMSAFEAHVINVTAKIENALSVSTDEINFGTVFPQEHLKQPLDISLSESFMLEDRVDDVNYIIRQKPKCGWTLDNGKNLLGLPTASGHVTENGEIVCPDPGNPLRPNGAVYGPLPLLCPYISKEKADNDPDENQNEIEIPAFHQPWVINNDTVIWTDAVGRLAKSDDDTVDNWVIDLAVPCFGNYCAQDWASWVESINPDAVAADYVQDIANEHKIFGCDLWVEVTGVSEALH